MLDLFNNPFVIFPNNALESEQLELIDMQNDENLWNKFNENNLLNFYRCFDKNNYNSLVDNAWKFGNLFELINFLGHEY